MRKHVVRRIGRVDLVASPALLAAVVALAACWGAKPPEICDTIAPVRVHAGGTTTVEVCFIDLNDDVLGYSAVSSNNAVATASTFGAEVTVAGVSPGSASITVTASDPGGLSAEHDFPVTVTPRDFDLDIGFTPGVPSAVRSGARESRDEWELVLGDTELDNVTFDTLVTCRGIENYVGTVDDHLVWVHVDSIDGDGGVLANAGYCYRRAKDNTPVISATYIDSADIATMEELDALVTVIFHEMAHALGFVGGRFELLGLLDEDAGGDPDPHFEGALAIEAFNGAGGDSYRGEKVPLQLEIYSHWRESVLGHEIMTPTISVRSHNPVSAVTLQAMADMGYHVDVSRAEEYELPDARGAPPPAVPGEDGVTALDLGEDVVFEPVMVVDADGRVLRVVPPPLGTTRRPPARRKVPVEREGRRLLHEPH